MTARNGYLQKVYLAKNIWFISSVFLPLYCFQNEINLYKTLISNHLKILRLAFLLMQTSPAQLFWIWSDESSSPRIGTAESRSDSSFIYRRGSGEERSQQHCQSQVPFYMFFILWTIVKGEFTVHQINLNEISKLFKMWLIF